MNQMALCFLLAGGLSTCPTSGAAILPGIDNYAILYNTAQPSTSDVSSAQEPNSFTADDSQQQSPVQQAGRPNWMEALRKAFNANERVDVQTPSQSVILAEPTEIPLMFHKPGLVALYVSQVQYLGRDHKAPDYAYGSQKVLQIHYRSDGSGYITIVPMRLGEVVLDMVGRYPDSGIIHKRITLNVRPPQKRPKKLSVTGPQGAVTRVLLSATGKAGGPWSHAYLTLSAMYDGVANSMDIDPSFAIFRIINWSGSTIPVDLGDQTGKLTPIRSGQALIVTTFGGRRSLTCVDVEETVLPNQTYDSHSCQALLSPGQKLGPQE